MLNTLQQPRQAKTTEPSRLPNMISYSAYSCQKTQFRKPLFLRIHIIIFILTNKECIVNIFCVTSR